MKLIDALGIKHQPVDAAQAPRIVSLVPSITELLCDLGLAQSLVGRTGFCIHPADVVRGIAKVGGTKDVNVDKISTFGATHLIVNIDENEKPTVDALRKIVPHVIVTHPLAPRDNLALYRLLGGVFGRVAQAEALCAQFESAAALLTPGAPQRVLYCIWKDPWMTVSRDTYIARMLEQIGWQQWPAPTSMARYPTFSWSDALVQAVDLVLLSSEPYHFGEAHVDSLEQQIGKPVRLVDGEMLSWYGSRAIAGLQYLRRIQSEC
ncbi:ABC-type Fe3+-hydroxamate transport system substrate-binding protein [Actimicrobium sp. GrIS 1.19]|uniref:helical backbone metal receptor n=1 Tax=Actimicrobium sp. GrIS 1.19 TaxID=3071708 RepID=UPI002E01290B|nr:ABC-type Fe3+-hydroxamate transport system substrate-binding protein [Actimicrobium sp. GrIS 1.19]